MHIWDSIRNCVAFRMEAIFPLGNWLRVWVMRGKNVPLNLFVSFTRPNLFPSRHLKSDLWSVAKLPNWTESCDGIYGLICGKILILDAHWMFKEAMKKGERERKNIAKNSYFIARGQVFLNPKVLYSIAQLHT